LKQKKKKKKSNITMPVSLKGLNAIVTGASSGIGESIAKSLAAEGLV